MTPYSPLTADIINRIREALGPAQLSTDPQALEECSHDTSALTCRPELVVHAQNTLQASRLLQLANEHRFPVTPRGGGTGLSGGALPVCGGVVLCMAAMNRILSIDTQNLIAEVEPGVINQDLRDAARAKGLFYPPDPASLDTSTIGGNAATNAGGPACVKYGTTRDYILGLEVVLPTGRVIRTGVKTRKGVVGYDMTHLIVGSEGTLGVITGITLKLIPHPPAVATMAVLFPSLQGAITAITQIMVRGHLPSAIEFMDRKCLELVGDLLPFDIPPGDATLLIVETDGRASETAAEIRRIGDRCSELGAIRVLHAPADSDRERIWGVRRQVSLRIHDAAGVYLSEDVVVPIARIAELVAGLPRIEARHQLKVYTFGHAGDGNIHLNFTAADPRQKAEMEKGIRVVLQGVLAMGGTISGEHGIGIAKQPFIDMELSGESVRLQKGIKTLFDPRNILNPEKIFNWREEKR